MSKQKKKVPMPKRPVYEYSRGGRRLVVETEPKSAKTESESKGK